MAGGAAWESKLTLLCPLAIFGEVEEEGEGGRVEKDWSGSRRIRLVGGDIGAEVIEADMMGKSVHSAVYPTHVFIRFWIFSQKSVEAFRTPRLRNETHCQQWLRHTAA